MMVPYSTHLVHTYFGMLQSTFVACEAKYGIITLENTSILVFHTEFVW